MIDNNLHTKIEQFVETLTILKKHYKWSMGDLSLRFVALIYTLNNKVFHKEEYDEIVRYIKNNSKWFSYYRGHQKVSTAALLITKFAEPQQAFTNLLEYEQKLKAGGFKNSPYLSIAAYALLLTCASKNVDERVQKAMELYTEMKKNHFWLTSSDDYPIAVLLAESDKQKDLLISEIENNYDMLHKEGFSRSNGLQFLSHLLTFVPIDAHKKAQQTRHIYDQLKREKLRVSSQYYGILGYLSLLGEFSEQAIGEVIEVVGYLRSSKGFKWAGKDINLLVATALVANGHIEKLSHSNKLLETSIGISIEAMIAAQTAVIIAASTAATAGAATAGN